MFGFDKITKKEIEDDNAMQLFAMQQACYLIKDGYGFKEAIEVAKSNVLNIIADKNVDNKLIERSCEFAKFGGDDFDIMLLKMTNNLKSFTVKQAIAQQYITNAKKTKRYYKKYFGIDTEINELLELLKLIKDGCCEFSPAKILIKTYPFLENKDNYSIKELSDIVLNSDCFDNKEIAYKLKQILKVVNNHPFLESTQRLRFLKLDIIMTIETDSIDLLTNNKNPLVINIKNLFEELMNSEKAKVKPYDLQMELSDFLDLEFVNENELEYKETRKDELTYRVKKESNKKRNKRVLKYKPEHINLMKQVYKNNK